MRIPVGRLVDQVIAVLTSVVFMMMAYRDSMMPSMDKNYTIELPAGTLESACGRQINCIPESK